MHNRTSLAVLATAIISLGGLSAPAMTARAAPAAPTPAASGDAATLAHDPCSPFERMAARLHLNPEQRAGMRKVFDAYQPRLHELRDRMRDNHRALDALPAGDPKLQELAAAQGKVVADAIVLRRQMHDEADKLLTDAQRSELRAMQQSRRHHEPHHPRHSGA